jgi:hypothetical protein
MQPNHNHVQEETDFSGSAKFKSCFNFKYDDTHCMCYVISCGDSPVTIYAKILQAREFQLSKCHVSGMSIIQTQLCFKRKLLF